MVKKRNARITITLTKKQVEWITKSSKRLDMSKSDFVKFIIQTNSARAIQLLQREYDLTDDDIIEIIKTPWVD